MKVLNTEEYIGEKINVKPVTKKALDDWFVEKDVDEKTKELIHICKLSYNKFTRRYDSQHSVHITDEYLKDGKFPLKFGKINGKFSCANCDSLVSMDGAPTSVLSFDCQNCKNLKSLVGAPQNDIGYYDCSDCGLETLDGAPNEVGNFVCDRNKLTNLNGAPKKVSWYFDCRYCHTLVSIEGAPKEIGGDFDLYQCTKLESLNGLPNKIGGELDLRGCYELKSSDLLNAERTLNGTDIKKPAQTLDTPINIHQQ